MTLTKLTMVAAAAVAMVFATSSISSVAEILGTIAKAEPVFFDTFDDGDATDGSPVTWMPAAAFDTGGYAVSGGDYVLTQPPGPAIPSNAKVAAAKIAPISDTSIRAQIRQLQGSGPISLLARGDPAAQTAYQAGISSDTGNVAISRNDGPGVPPTLVLAPANLNPSLQDVILQFDVIGNELSLYAWAAGQQKPTDPILRVVDDTYASGVPGLLIAGAGPHAAAFRFVQVATTSIPEPPAAMLSAIFFAGVFAWQWRRSR